MQDIIRIQQHILSAVIAHAKKSLAEECCGLLAGRGGVITHAFPATNALASATVYEIAPPELFALMRGIRASGAELMGIYHSHPNGKNEPSQRDIESAYYPDVAYFILTLRSDAPRPVRAFSICDGHVMELEIQIL